MGLDSLEPYMHYSGKGLILLCRTSNPGGSDLQSQRLVSDQAGGELLYERIARLATGEWNRGGQLGLVVGATFPQEVARVRELAPSLPLLIPGIGAQGGDAQATVRAGWRAGAPIIVSSSRAVLYAGHALDGEAGFADAARRVALATRDQLQRARPAR
jgi:orotidine-5'-phosphate decarboxylase